VRWRRDRSCGHEGGRSTSEESSLGLVIDAVVGTGITPAGALTANATPVPDPSTETVIALDGGKG
jgi:hypothetical protein